MFSINNKEGVIIAYRMDPKKMGQKKLNKICRKLYGYTDYSNKKKYTYRREGLLDRIPHIHLNPIRSVLILHKQDAEEALEILDQEGAETYTRVVKLTQQDLERMEESLEARKVQRRDRDRDSDSDSDSESREERDEKREKD